MPFVDSGKGEVGEGVVGVVIETHQVGLIHYLRQETCHTHIVTVVAVLPVDIGRNGIDILQVRHQRVAGSWRKESLVELRSIAEPSEVCIDTMASGEDIFSVSLQGISEECGNRRLALGSDIVAVLVHR